MIQRSVERIPQRILVAVVILVWGSAITIAATPYTDRIKFGVEYCENGIESNIWSVTHWVLKNPDKLKAVVDMFQEMRVRRP